MAKKENKKTAITEDEQLTPPAGEQDGAPVVKKKKKSFLKSKWFKRCVILLIIAALVGGYLVYREIKKRKEAEAAATSNTAVVTRGDITVKITGSGTVEPIDIYNIVPTVRGTIDASYYEEGDYVEEDAVLYKFESTQADNAIKTAENAIKTSQNNVASAENRVDQARTTLSNRADDVQKARDNIAKLTVYANSTGRVSDMALTVGNTANGHICTITDTNTLLVKIPFNAAQFGLISVGDGATVSIEKYMSTAAATVVRKYNAAGTGSDGSVVYDVELQISGGIELPAGTYVTATVHTASGDLTSSMAGTVYYPDPTAVNAEVSGKVKEIRAKNGDWVQKGSVLAVLESTDLQDALKTAQQNYTNAQTSLTEAQNGLQDARTNLENAQTSLEDRKKDAEDYTITAPISGVVMSKNYKAGDTIDGTSTATLMTIADMNKMKFTIYVDELDIARIALDQEVEVTSDALEGVELMGRITNISKLGSAQNGVTNYPVEVTIDEPGDLMSGMNVSAEIIVGESFNTILVPVTAVSYFEGKRYVTVVGQVSGMENMGRGRFEGRPDGEAPEDGEAAETPETPEASETSEPAQAPAAGMTPARAGWGDRSGGGRGSNSGGSNSGSSNSGGSDGENGGPQIEMFDEEQRVEVEVGLSNDDYCEIKSGLEVGQVVRDNGTGAGSSNPFQMMMNSMNGGGAPGGGGDRGNRGGAPGGGGPR